MADNLPQTLSAQLAGISRLTAHRQFGLVLGLAVVAALVIGAIAWAMQPRYVELLPPSLQAEFADARRALDRSDIPHRLDSRSRSLMVPDKLLAEAETALIGEGLFGDGSDGYELLDEELSISASRLQENSRYMRAIQGELERTLSSIAGVASARVFLAIPPDSVFARERDPVTASVTLNLRGRQLSKDEVNGIVHLVASSVPRLEVANVSVIDERAVLLNKGNGDELVGLHSEQLGFSRDVEESYRRSIENILAPLVGPGGMKVEVAADIDFTQTETASESFGSEGPAAVVSESIREDESASGVTGGVPGTLTNQPPAAAAVADRADETVEPDAAEPQRISRSTTRNYQNDRIISHVRQAGYSLGKLSISVVVDHREIAGENGETTRVARTPEELDRYAALVRSAVGFNEARGDSLTIDSEPFREPAPPELLPPAPIWQQPWVLDLARYLSAGLGILLLVMLVVRPVLKSLASLPAGAAPLPAGAAAAGDAALPGPAAQQPAVGSSPLGRARKVAAEDPRLVAHVVRQWMSADEAPADAE